MEVLTRKWQLAEFVANVNVASTRSAPQGRRGHCFSCGNSNRPWSSPIVLAPKKDGTYQFCVDFRWVNSVTKKDAHPMPRVDDILDQLGGSRNYSTLDLASGYWQVPLKEEDMEKTAFSVGLNHYEFKFMPFGLTNAPATFQRMMGEDLERVTRLPCVSRRHHNFFGNVGGASANIRRGSSTYPSCGISGPSCLNRRGPTSMWSHTPVGNFHQQKEIIQQPRRNVWPLCRLSAIGDSIF